MKAEGGGGEEIGGEEGGGKEEEEGGWKEKWVGMLREGKEG